MATITEPVSGEGTWLVFTCWPQRKALHKQVQTAGRWLERGLAYGRRHYSLASLECCTWPNGHPNHHISNCIICSWCNTFKPITRQKLHSNVAPTKTNSREKQIPDIEIPAHQYKTVCIHQWKYENKFQSQSNHNSFNWRPSKSNPHSINQKSVIFGMHKNTSSECLQHKCHIAP